MKVYQPPGLGYYGGPTLEEIAGKLERRRTERGPLHEAMRLIRDAYNGDIVIPLPEMNAAERPAVPNLIANGLEQMGQRIASVIPDVFYPSLRPGVKTADRRAVVSRRATQSWWEANRIGMKMRRRARWLIGYGMTPAIITPDFTRAIPRWEIRNPLSAFPAPAADPDEITPADAIFVYRRPYEWLTDRWPGPMLALHTGHRPGTAPPTETFNVLEYRDAECVVMAVLGRPHSDYSEWHGADAVELERYPNRIGVCDVVNPGRITLDRLSGLFDSTVGLYQMQARVMALEAIAVEKGIFPDMYLEPLSSGETPRFIDGPHDGRTGLVNIIAGGRMRELQSTPNFASTGLVDRLERAQRVTAPMPADFGGESGTNIRTGKRGDAVLTAAVSFPIQESQEILAGALEEENRRAVMVAKEYFGKHRKSFYVNMGKPGYVDYVPERDFPSDVNKVTYPVSGMDANSLVVGLGQRVGLGIMSKEGAAEIDPYITDPERERGRVTAESLEAALLASLQQQANAGTLPPTDLARIMELVARDGESLVDAVNTAQREAQERQASSGTPGEPDGPVPQGAPEAQPGLAPPGAGAEAPTDGGGGNPLDALRALVG